MSSITRRTLLGGLASVLTTGLAQAEPSPADEEKKTKLALVGGRLLRPDAEPLDDCVIVVEGDHIVSVGNDRAAVGGVPITDVKGQIVTAGFVDLLTRVGIEEVSLEPTTMDSAHRTDDAIRAAFRTADGYNPASSLIPICRRGGLTSVGVVPAPIPLTDASTQGLVGGQSAWADLAGDVPADAVARESLALHIHFDDASLGGYGHSRGTIMLRLRELFDDTRTYVNNKAAFDKRQVRELGTSRLDYEVVARALAGELPCVFHVDRASDIMMVMKLAADNGLRLVIASCAEGWRVAEHLAKAKVPVVVYPLDHGPRSFAALYAREDNAARLHQAGVTVALSTGESHHARKLAQCAGNAIRSGLPTQAALDGVTRAAARMLGMNDYGEVAAKQVANLVVWSGDPFELSSRATRVIVRGKETSLRTRQTALFERYKRTTSAVGY